MLGANPNLHKLPIYQEVEKVSGIVMLVDERHKLISPRILGSTSIPVYAFLTQLAE